MIKLEITEQEFSDLAALLDAGLKQIGIPAVVAAAGLVVKLDAAKRIYMIGQATGVASEPVSAEASG